MKMELPPSRYRALPLQVIDVDGGVILKRGLVEVRVVGRGAAGAVRTLLEAASGAGIAEGDVGALFAGAERSGAEALLRRLIERRFLVEEPGAAPGAAAGDPRPEEDPAAVFYWHFGEGRAEVAARVAGRRVVIVGVNRISRQLARSLRDSGISSFDVRDDPLLRNGSFFDDAGALRPSAWPAELGAPIAHGGGVHATDPGSFGCLVATAELGGMQLLRPWNEHCVLHRRLFLPVLLEDMIGHVGPLVVPGETACFECFRLRRSTHEADPWARRAIEAASSGGRPAAGSLPPMASVLGDVAAVELLKLLGLHPPVGELGAAVEVNLLASDMTARRVLRLPRCPVCTPLSERPTLAATKSAAAARSRGAA